MPEQVKRRKTHDGPPPSRAPPTESDLLAAQVAELRSALERTPSDNLVARLAELEDALRRAQEQERGARIATELLNMASRFEAGVGREELKGCIARLQDLAEETMVLDGASPEEAARAVAEARARGVNGAAEVVAAAGANGATEMQ